MQDNLPHNGLYINEFHRQNSMAAQREVLRMSLHPYSREQKVAQIEELHRMATTSKENSNAERSKLNV
jgi:hypothetical protein